MWSETRHSAAMDVQAEADRRQFPVQARKPAGQSKLSAEGARLIRLLRVGKTPRARPGC